MMRGAEAIVVEEQRDVVFQSHPVGRLARGDPVIGETPVKGKTQRDEHKNQKADDPGCGKKITGKGIFLLTLGDAPRSFAIQACQVAQPITAGNNEKQRQ